MSSCRTVATSDRWAGEGRSTSRGVARLTALTLGLLFVAASVASSLTQDRWSWLQFTPLIDGIEWGLGALLVLGAVGGEGVARTLLRIVGPVLMVAAAAGWIVRADMGDWLGFTIGLGLPGAYPFGFALTGVAAATAGFGSGRERRA